MALAVLFHAAECAALDAEACERFYESGQAQVSSGHPIAAKADFAQCMSETCPRLIRSDCTKRYEDASARVPGIVFGARSSSGADLVNVVVEVDGQRVLDSLTGKLIEVEPGAHRVRYVAGHVVDEFDVVAREGERQRIVMRDLPVEGASSAPSPAPSSSPPPPEHRAIPWTVYAAGGTAAAAWALFGVFSIYGVSEYHSLEERCSPGCSSSDQSALRTKFLVADISLGVALVATAATVWLYLSRPSSARAQTTTPLGLTF